MNILLFAPGLLILFLVEKGIWKTVINLVICASLQVVIYVEIYYQAQYFCVQISSMPMRNKKGDIRPITTDTEILSESQRNR